eukprot:1151913-Pelagomonas_calceolata.AAC.10
MGCHQSVNAVSGSADQQLTIQLRVNMTEHQASIFYSHPNKCSVFPFLENTEVTSAVLLTAATQQAVCQTHPAL